MFSQVKKYTQEDVTRIGKDLDKIFLNLFAMADDSDNKNGRDASILEIRNIYFDLVARKGEWEENGEFTKGIIKLKRQTPKGYEHNLTAVHIEELEKKFSEYKKAIVAVNSKEPTVQKENEQRASLRSSG